MITLRDLQKLEGKELDIAVKEGLLTPKMSYYMNMEAMCRKYKWTPKQFMEQDPKYIEIFKTILIGKGDDFDM